MNTMIRNCSCFRSDKAKPRFPPPLALPPTSPTKPRRDLPTPRVPPLAPAERTVPPAAAGELGLHGKDEGRRKEAMGQQPPLIYACVARDSDMVVLAEHTEEFTGTFTPPTTFRSMVELPVSNNVTTFKCDGFAFSWFIEDRLIYCVAAVESVERQLHIAFLLQIKDDFSKRYGGRNAASAAASSLYKEFGSKLKEHMQYCVDHSEEIVKNLVMENVGKVPGHLEMIGQLVDRTNNLRLQAEDFYRLQGTHVRGKTWRIQGLVRSLNTFNCHYYITLLLLLLGAGTICVLFLVVSARPVHGETLLNAGAWILLAPLF